MCLYKLKPIAELVKVALEMVIGVGIVVLITLKLFDQFGDSIDSCFFFNSHIKAILQLPTLEIVGRALAYTAAIELAYMLFTPGPDEAIAPLITGLASALLMSISRIDNTTVDLNRVTEVSIYVIVLAGLFLVNAIFAPENKAQNINPQVSNPGGLPIQQRIDNYWSKLNIRNWKNLAITSIRVILSKVLSFIKGNKSTPPTP